MLIENAGVLAISIASATVALVVERNSPTLMSSSKTENCPSTAEGVGTIPGWLFIRRWICAFAVLEKCWVLVNLDYQTSPWQFGGRPRGFGISAEAAEKVIARDESLERWPLLQEELKYRYEQAMGGAILT